jgi:hypothetical protein
MERKPTGDAVDNRAPGTTWKARGPRLRRSMAAVALGGALVLGMFGMARHAQVQTDQQQVAGNTWSAKRAINVPSARHYQPQPNGSTWS